MPPALGAEKKRKEKTCYILNMHDRGWTHRSEMTTEGGRSPWYLDCPWGCVNTRDTQRSINRWRWDFGCSSADCVIFFSLRKPWKGRRKGGKGCPLESSVSASNFTDNEVARPNVYVFLLSRENRKYGGDAKGVLRELLLALRARADIKFSKFYNIDSQHARNNVFRGNFCVAREIIMIIWLEERHHNLYQKGNIYFDSFCCIFFALVVSSWKAKLIHWKLVHVRACACVYS